MTPPMDRTRLAAFVDGELGPEDSAAVVMHLADHPADQAYVDDLFAANAALAAAFSAPMHEPVPDRIRSLIDAPEPTHRRQAEVLPFRRRTLALGAGMAIAASLVATALLVDRSAGVSLALGPVPSDSPLGIALDSLPSGTPQQADDGREVMVLATLPTPAGHCREVELIDRPAGTLSLALACRETGADWQVAVVLTEPLALAGTEDGFVAADGAEVQGLSPFLDARAAGEALSPDAEADLISRDWQP